MSDLEDLENITDQEVWNLLKIEKGIERARVLYELSKRNFSKKNYTEALVLADESNKKYLEFENVASNIEIADSYMAIAYNYKELNDPEGVILNIKMALEKFKLSGVMFNPLASEMLVEAYESTRQYELAINELQNIANNYEFDQITGDIVFIMIKISENLKKLNRFEESMATAENAKKIAISKNSENQVCYLENLIAENLFELGKFDEALEKLNKVVDIFSLFGKDYQEFRAKLIIGKILKSQKKLTESHLFFEDLSFKISEKSIDDKDLILELENEIIQTLELIDKDANMAEIEVRKRRIINYEQLMVNKE